MLHDAVDDFRGGGYAAPKPLQYDAGEGAAHYVIVFSCYCCCCWCDTTTTIIIIWCGCGGGCAVGFTTTTTTIHIISIISITHVIIIIIVVGAPVVGWRHSARVHLRCGEVDLIRRVMRCELGLTFHNIDKPEEKVCSIHVMDRGGAARVLCKVQDCKGVLPTGFRSLVQMICRELVEHRVKLRAFVDSEQGVRHNGQEIGLE